MGGVDPCGKWCLLSGGGAWLAGGLGGLFRCARLFNLLVVGSLGGGMARGRGGRGWFLFFYALAGLFCAHVSRSLEPLRARGGVDALIANVLLAAAVVSALAAAIYLSGALSER
ncbi:MAG: hypothetical protein QXJ21_02145 [Thermofilum sp.]